MLIFSFTLIYSLILPNKGKYLLSLNSQTRVSNLLLFTLLYSDSSSFLFTLTPLTYSPPKRTLRIQLFFNLLLQATKTFLIVRDRSQPTPINGNDKCRKSETHQQWTKKWSAICKTHRSPTSQLKVSPFKHVLLWNLSFGGRPNFDRVPSK